MDWDVTSGIMFPLSSSDPIRHMSLKSVSTAGISFHVQLWSHEMLGVKRFGLFDSHVRLTSDLMISAPTVKELNVGEALLKLQSS